MDVLRQRGKGDSQVVEEVEGGHVIPAVKRMYTDVYQERKRV